MARVRYGDAWKKDKEEESEHEPVKEVKEVKKAEPAAGYGIEIKRGCSARVATAKVGGTARLKPISLWS